VTGSRPDAQPVTRLSTFEELSGVDDAMLRQLAARTHIIDLAYAFGSSDPALLERLTAVVRPGLAEEIRVALRMLELERQRFRLDDQIRVAKSRVLDLARAMLAESVSEPGPEPAGPSPGGEAKQG
jgi:hypothetical protein